MDTVWDFLIRVEDIVTNKVYGNFPIDWDEDFITRDLLRALRQVEKRQLRVSPLDERYPYFPYPGPLLPYWIWEHLAGTVLNVEWSSYKQTGTPERYFGDVAVLVLAQYYDGDRVEGVGFLEAKKRDRGNTKFGAIKVGQLKRIFRHAPRASLLLYDYEPVCYLHPIRLWKWVPTFAVTVPIDLSLATGKRDTSLYKFSKPFSAQLLLFLIGFELERSKAALNIAKGLEDRFGAPRHLLIIRVGVNTDAPSEDFVAFNRDRYVPIEE